ncbi:MAG: lipid-transfer protein [Proteobacteria bacterium]|nr:lipid-transfer protein [Pseudomonadota bacterium]HQR02779.1 lipid-transfer protein [Rhodocyclaceae bacterium]
MKDQVAIVGIGETSFGKGFTESELELGCSAIRNALQDAGIAAGEVDGVACYTMEETPEFEYARNLGFGDLSFFSRVHYGGGAGCGIVGQAAMAIATGQANVAVVWRARKRSGKASRVWAQTPPRLNNHWKWSQPWGLLRPVDEVALLARRYFHDHGASRDTLGHIAVTLRNHALNNPRAMMHNRPLSLAEYQAARMISDPLCLFDNCLESDGAVAVVLARRDHAQDCRQRPAYIHAWSQGLARGQQNMPDVFGADPFASASAVAARKLWQGSDIGPADIQVAQIYDAFSPLILFSLEAYGLCGRGEAAAFVESGGIAVNGGRLPVNTAGGSLSEAYIHGFNLITEGVRQLRGTAQNQVAGAATCLVTSCDATPTSALLLRN